MDELHAVQSVDTSSTSSMPPPPPSPPPPIAPGTAQITATILSAEETEAGFHCILRVEQVLRYGATTPPLPAGADIQALVASHVIESMAPETSMKSLIEPASMLKITLKHTGMGQMLGSTGPEWRVTTITR